jgi:hypothetical protein
MDGIVVVVIGTEASHEKRIGPSQEAYGTTMITERFFSEGGGGGRKGGDLL